MPIFWTNLGAKIQIFRIIPPLKTVNFDTKIKIDHFPAVHEFVVFGQKMDIWHTVLSITRLIGSFLAQIHDDLRSSSVESVEVSAMFSI